MKKLLLSGLAFTISLTLLSGCSGDLSALSGLLSGKGSVIADKLKKEVNFTSEDKKAGENGKAPKDGNRPGKEPRWGKDGGQPGRSFRKGPVHGLFVLPPELNLTAEQKKQLAELKPEKPDQLKMEEIKKKMDELRKEVETAFLSDNFDDAALEAKFDALEQIHQKDRQTAEAERMIKVYNILTPEQRNLLEQKMAENEAKRPDKPDFPPQQPKVDDHLNKLATELGLSEAQKNSLKEVMTPPVLPSPEEMRIKRKAVREAVNSVLKSGKATTQEIVSILQANAPEKQKKPDHLEKMAKIHALLTPEQRKKFIEIHSKEGFFGPGRKRDNNHPRMKPPGFPMGRTGGEIAPPPPPPAPPEN